MEKGLSTTIDLASGLAAFAAFEPLRVVGLEHDPLQRLLALCGQVTVSEQQACVFGDEDGRGRTTLRRVYAREG